MLNFLSPLFETHSSNTNHSQVCVDLHVCISNEVEDEHKKFAYTKNATRVFYCHFSAFGNIYKLMCVSVIQALNRDSVGIYQYNVNKCQAIYASSLGHLIFFPLSVLFYHFCGVSWIQSYGICMENNVFETETNSRIPFNSSQKLKQLLFFMVRFSEYRNFYAVLSA